MVSSFDIIIIGSGPGGYRAATYGALRGFKIAIVEKELWGGCCLNRGCVPKKAWHTTAKTVQQSKQFAKRGLHGALWANLGAAWAHQHDMVTTVRESYLSYMKRLGVKRFEGIGRLANADAVIVEAENGRVTTLNARHIILATGASAYAPDGLTPTAGKILTTDMLFDSPPPPGDRVGVVGGGVVGTEFAFILQQFGLKISWLSTSAPLARSDFSVAAKEKLHKTLKDLDLTPNIVKGKLSASINDYHVSIKLGHKTLAEVDWILLGTGRKPNTRDIGLENLQLDVDAQGFITRNDYLQTKIPTIYAIGDCANPMMTANHALAEATTAINNIAQDTPTAHSPTWIPQAIYSAVEMARIGLNEDQAEDANIETALGFAAFETSPAALGQFDSDGFVRLIADTDSKTLVGAEIVGDQASELIHAVLQQNSEAPALGALLQRAYNHPSRAEEILNATETMLSKWKLDDAFSIQRKPD